jgi:8-oxo-dGTP pyrophosphatase MutT (NUDIX family)
VPTIADLRSALAGHPARVLAGRRRAAVAMVLHEVPAGLDFLFIERARRVGDPWSGHMAFPGGRVDRTDRDERAAAERETLEEVGLDLRDAEPLGRLDDLHAGVRLVAPLVLSAFVYRIDPRPPLALNHEVREALWVPVDVLLDPARHVGWRYGPTRLPGVCVGEPDRHVVWGLTHQLLDAFFRVAGVRWPR